MLFLALYALGDPRCQGAVDSLHFRRQMCLLYSARHTSDNTQECSRCSQFQLKFIQLSADVFTSPPCACQVHPRSMIGANKLEGIAHRRLCVISGKPWPHYVYKQGVGLHENLTVLIGRQPIRSVVLNTSKHLRCECQTQTSICNV